MESNTERRRRLRRGLGERVDSEPGAMHEFQRRVPTQRGAARSRTLPLNPPRRRR